MKTILLIIVLLSGIKASAQTPQYYADYHPGGLVLPIGSIGFSDTGGCLQALYPRDSFKNKPPYGKIKNIYLRGGDYIDSIKPCTQYGVKVSMGYTTLQNLDTVTQLFKTLTQVFVSDSIVVDNFGGWVKMPLMAENAFFYDTTQSLIIEIRVGTPLTSCEYLRSRYPSYPYRVVILEGSH